MAAKNGGSDGPVSKYETEEGLKEVAAFLRGRNGMPLRPAIEVDKRVEYFKGETKKDRGLHQNTAHATQPIDDRCSMLLTHRSRQECSHGLASRLILVSMPARWRKDRV